MTNNNMSGSSKYYKDRQKGLQYLLRSKDKLDQKIAEQIKAMSDSESDLPTPLSVPNSFSTLNYSGTEVSA